MYSHAKGEYSFYNFPSILLIELEEKIRQSHKNPFVWTLYHRYVVTYNNMYINVDIKIEFAQHIFIEFTYKSESARFEQHHRVAVLVATAVQQ